jgi:phage FluMu protein Com
VKTLRCDGMAITFQCPECRILLKAREDQSRLRRNCPRCATLLTVPELTVPPINKAVADRPWTPIQILAAGLLFGPAACGVVAGVNFSRLGKRAYRAPCVLVGITIFLLEAVVLAFLLRDTTARVMGLMVNVGVGLGFLLVQRPYFAIWKAINWTPAQPGETYRPNRTGLLFSIGFACLVGELGVLLLLLALRGW